MYLCVCVNKVKILNQNIIDTIIFYIRPPTCLNDKVRRSLKHNRIIGQNNTVVKECNKCKGFQYKA